MKFVNCKKLDTCEEYAHGVCPCSLAGESVINLVITVGACPSREPYPPKELVKVRQEFLDAIKNYPATKKHTEELRMVEKGGS